MDEGYFGYWNSDTPKPTNWQDLRDVLHSNPLACSEAEYDNFADR